MSLAKRNEREYLDIEDSGAGFRITVKREHAQEVSALLTQYGFAHERTKDSASNEQELFFAAVADRRKVAEVLASYKNVKGS